MTDEQIEAIQLVIDLFRVSWASQQI
jgi:hypothetical protein